MDPSPEKNSKEDLSNELAKNYLRLRRTIGFLGLFLPLILFLGCKWMGYCEPYQASISCYYHTIMRNVFVAVLSIFGIILIFYNYKLIDNILTSLAGICAFGIAFCPTYTTECGCCGVDCTKSDVSGTWHLIFAVSFFVIISVICLWLFPKYDKETPEWKKKRRWIYYVCGVGMILSMIVIGINMKFGTVDPDDPSHVTFWGESAALFFFGVAWVIKGEVTASGMKMAVVNSITNMKQFVMKAVRGE